MTIFARLLCGIAILCGWPASLVLAQGCAQLDKHQLANAMGIDQELIPWMNLEIPTCANIHVGGGYAGFVLDEVNVKLHEGVRSEISIDYPFVEGDTIEYRWSILVPSQGAPGGDAHQWWLIAQWHDQPDFRVGETWATLKAQPPPVAIFIESRNGVPGIGLYGLPGKKISWSPVPTDVWLDLGVVVHWSTASGGSVRFFIDGHPEFDVTATGRNMLNGYRHYFKVGQYRAPWIRQLSVLYVRNVRFRKL
jgi:hypothetical protein